MKKYVYALLVSGLHLLIPSSSCCMDIKKMTLDQKIGQLFMVAAVANEDIAQESKSVMKTKSYCLDKDYVESLICQYHIGGIIYLGLSDGEKQKARTAYFQSRSVIPLLVGQDLEPGRVGGARLECLKKFPSNEYLGIADNEGATQKFAGIIGQLCKQVGVHINFAPVADVNNNPDNPVINDRSFGADPRVVARHAIAFACGLQEKGIIGCAKHFPGHGDTNIDSHKALPKITHDRERLDAIELYPFKELIAAGIPAIMIAHLEVPVLEPQKGLPSSLSKNIVTTLLRQELGYRGLIITDALDMEGVKGHFKPGECELYALLAGNDILLCSADVPAAVTAIKNALCEGLISEQIIDEHVERIMHIKKLAGLF